MLAVFVHVNVKPEHTEAFKAASIKNAQLSVQEPGVARFDVVQQKDAPERFVLIEVYKTSDGPAAHKQAAHYAEWRDTVEEMMAEPRRSVKYETVAPDDAGW